MTIGKVVTKGGGEELENWFFNFYFLNLIYFLIMKFHILIENI